MGTIDRGADGYDSGDNNDGIDGEPDQRTYHRVASDRRMMISMVFGACDERTASGTDGGRNSEGYATRRNCKGGNDSERKKTHDRIQSNGRTNRSQRRGPMNNPGKPTSYEVCLPVADARFSTLSRTAVRDRSPNTTDPRRLFQA